MTFSTGARIAAVLGAIACSLMLLDANASRAGLMTTPAEFPSCGAYWNRNTLTTAAERRVNKCIVRAALEGRHARAVATLTTVEGDPIVNYVFVRGKRDVLVVVDSTRDAFGARTWQRLRSKGLVVIHGRLGWTGCRPVGAGKPSWLVPVRLSG